MAIGCDSSKVIPKPGSLTPLPAVLKWEVERVVAGW